MHVGNTHRIWRYIKHFRDFYDISLADIPEHGPNFDLLLAGGLSLTAR